MLNFYRKAIGIRQGNAALKTGSVEVLEAGEDVLVLKRVADGESVTCVYNFGSGPKQVPPAKEKKLSSAQETGL